MKEEKFMQKCLKLAEKGRPFVSPNPMVGAVVEKNGKIIACGFHARFGREHAETIALKRAGKAAKGAQLFVNLEPCCHLGKQPPCTQAIIKAGIKKVVVATIDPNPLINGKGVKELKKHGIVVKTGVLEKEAQELNEKFFKYKKTGLPFVLVKNAISANRVLAGKKISGKKSIQKVHLLRSEFDAILAGANTVIKDNPKLTARFKGTRNTLRMIVDSRAKIPIDSKVFDKKAPTIIVCTKKAKKNRVKKIVQKGAGILIAKEKNGKVDLKNMLLQLGKSGVSSVLVEGGAQITKSFLKEKLETGFVGNDCWVTLYPQKKF
ncbi:MAG: bifunctional diaminohydroxyphosphoribosylaminopyrimidine deaminase/5-amino-6-(5-phosphoribosylamino)uracil reductase RibD [Candidatus Diapherotrites archaeon]|nr:bifunctional diaminohydroxyphosphoribosylaminopyrimidine deaminase/5-amino-6-(5-phosphoribosylamino)uracil reductase RibD [Candidatus Diapherotrites archaeon]